MSIIYSHLFPEQINRLYSYLEGILNQFVDFRIHIKDDVVYNEIKSYVISYLVDSFKAFFTELSDKSIDLAKSDIKEIEGLKHAILQTTQRISLLKINSNSPALQKSKGAKESSSSGELPVLLEERELHIDRTQLILKALGLSDHIANITSSKVSFSLEGKKKISINDIKSKLDVIFRKVVNNDPIPSIKPKNKFVSANNDNEIEPIKSELFLLTQQITKAERTKEQMLLDLANLDFELSVSKARYSTLERMLGELESKQQSIYIQQQQQIHNTKTTIPNTNSLTTSLNLTDSCMHFIHKFDNQLLSIVDEINANTSLPSPSNIISSNVLTTFSEINSILIESLSHHIDIDIMCLKIVCERILENDDKLNKLRSEMKDFHSLGMSVLIQDHEKLISKILSNRSEDLVAIDSILSCLTSTIESARPFLPDKIAFTDSLEVNLDNLQFAVTSLTNLCVKVPHVLIILLKQNPILARPKNNFSQFSLNLNSNYHDSKPVQNQKTNLNLEKKTNKLVETYSLEPIKSTDHDPPKAEPRATKNYTSLSSIKTILSK